MIISAVWLQILSRPIGRGRKTEGYRSAFEILHDFLRRRAIFPIQQQTVGGQQFGELPKGGFDFRQILETIEMIRLDAQNDGMFRPQMQKVFPIFAGFHDKEILSAGLSAGGFSDRSGAAKNRGIPARLRKNMCDHRRGRRFAVRAGDGKRNVGQVSNLSRSFHDRLETCPTLSDFSQGLKVAQNGNAQFGGAANFGIFGRNGIAVDDDVGIRGKIFGGMALNHQIRTADAPSPAAQHIGQSAHSVAADADQMSVRTFHSFVIDADFGPC